MRTRIPTLLAAAALLGTAAAPPPLHGQDSTVDSRWLAYLGCWEAVGPAKTHLCVVPVTGTAAVDLVTIANGAVVARDRIAATGERLATTHGDCSGWQSATWSDFGDRVYLRSEETCTPGSLRPGTGLIAPTRDGQWLYIQGMTLGTQTGVRVQRYHEVTTNLLLPQEIADALHLDLTATMQARAAAAAPLTIDDLVDASRHVDAAVVEAWLVERGGSFTLDAKRLLALAKGGVPSRTIDVLVALSYPGVFSINASSRRGERRVSSEESYGGGAGPSYPIASCGMDYTFYPYGSGYCDGLMTPWDAYGYGWFPGNYPVVIIYTGSGGGGGGGGGSATSMSHGRVINGQGYQEGPRSTADVSSRWGEPRSTSNGGSSGAATPAPSTSTSSGSEQRTAKPRP
jgi:hypothetical protein